jgi:hypothetical protein
MKTPKRYKCRCCDWLGNKGRNIKFTGFTFVICPVCNGALDDNSNWIDYMTEKARKEKVLSVFGDFREKGEQNEHTSDY